jgi:A/G-specific adenine glycosylase
VTLTGALLSWYSGAARDLPWRRPEAGPWGVLVSEVMLQQTPVARVLPAYDAWLLRWPAPAALAADSRGEAVRMWGRLGYPRRALRLHECAAAIVERHGGAVPDELAALLALPGVGAYTARAVATFGYGRRHAVVDTNVRRVATRLVTGEGRAGAGPGRPGSSSADLALVEPLLPERPATAARFSAALMELGALVCTARSPRCTGCPVAGRCAWRRAGYPEPAGAGRPAQGYAGTDRQVRGLLLAVLRGADGPVPPAALDAVWPDAGQRARALGTLVTDGLVDPLPDGTYGLPA